MRPASNALFAAGVLLLLLGAIPALITFPIVGPANALYYFLVTAACVAIMLRVRALFVAILVAGLFSVAQFVTPVPFWLCVESGYSICNGFASLPHMASEYNIGDGVLFMLLVAGYVMTWMGLRKA